MDMRMVGHRLAPGVKHGGDADLGAEPSGVGGDGLQCSAEIRISSAYTTVLF